MLLLGTTTSKKPGPDCPSPSEDIIYLPYDGDCSKYWECFEGDAYLYGCPTGLWWHQEVSQCDYPGDYCVDSTSNYRLKQKSRNHGICFSFIIIKSNSIHCHRYIIKIL
jgi:hypothetical protein